MPLNPKTTLVDNRGLGPVSIIIVVAVLAIVVGGVLYLREVKKINLLRREAATQRLSQGTPPPLAEKTSKGTSTQVAVLDCKQNLGCLTQAATNCKLAKVVNTATTDILGVKQTTTSLFEIKGSEADKCKFYLRTERINLTFPPNVPSEVVNEQKEVYKKLEGREGICKFNTGDLTAMLTRWEKGIFESGTVSCKSVPGQVSCQELSTGGRVCAPEGSNKSVCKTEGGDFGVAECQGTYFESSL